MPKRKSLYSRGLIIRNEESDESDENVKSLPKRIRPDRSSLKGHKKENSFENSPDYFSLSNNVNSEPSDSEFNEELFVQAESSSPIIDDQEYGEFAERENKNGGCYDGFDCFLKSFRFFSEDEDSLEKLHQSSSKNEEIAGNVESPETDQDDSFMDTRELEQVSLMRMLEAENLPERIRVLPFPSQRTEIVFMDHPVSVPLFGHLKVTLLNGRASIQGFELTRREPVTVFSQKQTGLLSITSLPFENNTVETRRELKRMLKKFLIKTDPKLLKKKLKGNIKDCTVVVSLQELPLPPNLQFLQLYANEALSFTNVGKKGESSYTSVLQNEEHQLRFCEEHQQLFHLVEKHLLKINKRKQNEVEESVESDFSSLSSDSDSSSSSDIDDMFDISDQRKFTESKVTCNDESRTHNSENNVPQVVQLTGSRILIYGPKKSGKSTMLRFLINKFLNKHSEVFFLDTDPGQTEFTPPGVVSLTKVTEPLFGPPYTHLRKPLKMVFTGSITAETSPPMHTRSVIKLINYFNSTYPDGILLVNTMGWIVGIGEMMLHVIRKNLKPTVEIELSDQLTPLHSSVEGKVLKCTVGFQRDSASSTKKGDFRPADLRDWALLSYFGQLQEYFKQPTYMNAMRTVGVCWDDVAVYNFNKRLPYNRYLEALNCSIVALCHVDKQNMLLPTSPEYPNTLVDEPDNECIGYGLVRAVDETQHLLIINTPVALKSLAKVNAILSGNILVPRSVILKQPIYDQELDYTDESALGRTETRKAIRRRSRVSKIDKK